MSINIKNWPEELEQAIEKLSNYLNILLAIDYDIDAIDRIAKSRSQSEFYEAIYNALRRKFTLENKIKELENKKSREDKTVIKALENIKGFNPTHIEIIKKNLSKSEQSISIKEIASYIGIKSISHTNLYSNLRKLVEES